MKKEEIILENIKPSKTLLGGFLNTIKMENIFSPSIIQNNSLLTILM
jgi:hypothetical protein